MRDAAPDEGDVLDLLHRAQDGDREAFEELAGRYRAPLEAFVHARLDARLAARVNASDVVQEAWLEVVARLPDYLERRPMPFRTWLWKTAYERLLKVRRHHRRARRDAGREVGWPDRSSLLAASLLGGSSPSSPLNREELALQVREALGQLSETDAEILMMRSLDELPYAEIAVLLDVEPEAARQRYGRALLRLRGVLLASGLLEPEP